MTPTDPRLKLVAGGGPRWAAMLMIGLVVVSTGDARTLRLFTVGNSFSNNATKYLPELAKAGGHELILGKAQAGGCSLERHWNAVEAFLADPNDRRVKSTEENRGMRTSASVSGT